MNAGNTSTQAWIESTNIPFLDAFMFALALMLSVFICLVNTLTILVVSRTPSLRTLANIYVVSLASVDFVIGLGLIPTALFVLPPTRVALFYRYIDLCVLMNGINLGMAGNSIFHMAFVSVDRYLYITKPYFYERVMTGSVVASLVSTAWTVSLGYVVLPHFIHTSFDEVPKCDGERVLPAWYLFYSTWGIYFAVVLVILVMYSLILRTAFKQRQAIHVAGPAGFKGTSTATMSRSTAKTVKFFLTVFGVFFVCMTPSVVCLGLNFVTYVPLGLYNFLNMVALTNSGMNFIILTVQNTQFRRALFKLLHCTCWLEN
ncbi:unnamed protein product, partial [Lymnaea stagnalis]